LRFPAEWPFCAARRAVFAVKAGHAPVNGMRATSCAAARTEDCDIAVA
jgi:hypothetical protein